MSVFGFGNLRRRYGSREGAPQPHPSRSANGPTSGLALGHAGSRVGAGAASADPYLLRSFFEAGNPHLVAAPSADSPMRLSVVRGGCPRPRPAWTYDSRESLVRALR
jgi:hypothetical protein